MKTSTPTPPELVGALDALGIVFLAGGTSDVHLSPIELLQGLSRAPEARLRSAIIPLVLRHPEFAPDARAAAQSLTGVPRVTLECYYSAGFVLQSKYRERLERMFGPQTRLPDWFSAGLGLARFAGVDADLRALGDRHAVLTGLPLNWVGTYLHSAERFMRHCEAEERWNQPTAHRAA